MNDEGRLWAFVWMLGRGGVLATTAAQNIVGIAAALPVFYILGASPRVASPALVVILLFLVYSNERSFRFAKEYASPALQNKASAPE